MKIGHFFCLKIEKDGDSGVENIKTVQLEYKSQEYIGRNLTYIELSNGRFLLCGLSSSPHELLLDKKGILELNFILECVMKDNPEIFGEEK